MLIATNFLNPNNKPYHAHTDFITDLIAAKHAVDNGSRNHR